ncbi:5-methylcytosine rRNA methyltransferase NSUN4 [Sitodiplosis mosellana]|uniref:5-methylcytosine rRNA methyltransferase NSUN4 n=1 Tax=Sitodiplosis mosellana TaxID=263140 RepID=UPI0024451DF8|nr:5-methylcytosine rRNA methyltransferase NSUN4 [Sitodiplosis mosellana]
MLRQQPLIIHIVKRFKKTKPGLFVKPRDLKKATSIDRALEHFDDFYKSVYGPRWGGIRASLLCENKFAALVNNHGEPEQTREQIELNGGVNIRKVFDVYFDSSATVETTVRTNQSTRVDRTVDKYVQEKQKSEMRAIYQQHVEEEEEKLALEKREDPSRVIDMADVVDYKKSLQKSLAEDSEFDFNRMISAEVGVMGLQEFIPATKLKGMEDFIPESDHYQYYNTAVDFPLTFEPETDFLFPKTLDIYMYPKGDISRFSRPKNTATKVLSHFLLDAASILPPLMLNVQPGDVVFDACAAPGGKSLILLQSLLPKTVVCNDVSQGRVNRLYKLFFQYLPDFTEKWQGDRCIIQNHDIREVNEFSKYDKILVDVPCSNDRQSVTENENSWFRGDRHRERLQLPELQAAILVQCLQLLKPGGSLVYSTCSLSPIQNDGVVNMALTKAFTDYHITATIKDLTNVLQPFKKLFYFENTKNLKFGQLVLPQLPCNSGPMYFCKIQRNEN